MTLDTSIVIGRPTDVHKLFAFCRELLGTPPGTPIDTWDKHNARENNGIKWLGNPGGIGLPAWLIIRYGIDGPFPLHTHDKWCSTELGGEYDTTQADIDEHAEWVKNNPRENGWTAVEVSFDTAYGYRGENGETCSDLHARLVTALGRWLDERDLPWKWQNEYTGEWFDRYDQLDKFGDAHRATGADAWFRHQVLPAIATGAAERES